MSESNRERWDRRYAQASHPIGDGPDWIAAVWESEPRAVPETGKALDVAAGTGTVALWLAARGFEVSAVDVSPVGLEQLAASARERGLKLDTFALDLADEPLPAGPFSLITCFHYLQRDLFPQFAARLGPGGILICEIGTRRNLERHARPPAHFLLEPGELPGLCAGLEIVHQVEDWFDDRADARVIARRASA